MSVTVGAWTSLKQEFNENLSHIFEGNYWRMPKEEINKRKTNFLRKYAATDNYICKIFSNCAEAELIELTVTFPT